MLSKLAWTSQPQQSAANWSDLYTLQNEPFSGELAGYSQESNSKSLFRLNEVEASLNEFES